MNGLYSGTLDNQVVYIGEDAEHIFVGSMIRLKDQRNLTKDLVMQNNRIRWSDLPLQDAIKTVKVMVNARSRYFQIRIALIANSLSKT